MRNKFRLFRVAVADIVINDRAREGCSSCSGDKRKLCPLEIGYEKQKYLEESTAFVHGHKFAVLVSTDLPDESDRPGCKSVWEDLVSIERHFDRTYNLAHAFKFPMTCPFCLPKECKLSKGECTFPSHYGELHETYNINIPETLGKVFGDTKPAGICSIILVR